MNNYGEWFVLKKADSMLGTCFNRFTAVSVSYGDKIELMVDSQPYKSAYINGVNQIVLADALLAALEENKE